MSESQPSYSVVPDCERRPDEERLRNALRADVFRALGEERRLAVVARLACSREPMTVSEITECCGVHISGVSRHLQQLRDAGIVRATRSGRQVLYELDTEALEATLRGLLDALANCRTGQENP